MTEPDLRLRAVVPARPKVVYEALTDPAALRVWLAEHADVDLPAVPITLTIVDGVIRHRAA